MDGELRARHPPYRWHAFTHWLNLAFLTGAIVGGALVDPIIWLLAAPLELGALWVIPDLPPFRAQVDRWRRVQDFAREKAYYMSQLWELVPPLKTTGQRMLEWFADTVEEDVESRVIHRDDAFQQYAEMRETIGRLKQLEKVRGVSIVSHEMTRFEQVTIGYLRYLVACKFFQEALRGIDAARLRKELAEIDEQIASARPDLRPVLVERRRLCETQLERLPKLQATLELFRTRAAAIVYQMRSIHSQVLADPGVNVNAFLEDMIEKNELLSDALSDLEADQAVREVLRAPESQEDERRRSRIALEGKKLRQE